MCELNFDQKVKLKIELLKYFDINYLKSFFYDLDINIGNLDAFDSDRLANDLIRFSQVQEKVGQLLDLASSVAPQGTWQHSAPDTTASLQTEQGMLDQVLERFMAQSAAILLAQEHRFNRGLVGDLLQRLQQAFGEKAVWHVVLPNNAQLSEADFFRCIGQRCGLSEVTESAFALEQALLARLQFDNAVCWLVTGLERCQSAWVQALANVLRNVEEQAACQALLCGGEQLAELRYGNGALSVLSYITEVEELPEFSVCDVQALAQGLKVAVPTAALAGQMLAVSGGHPVLLEQCLRKGMALDEAALVSNAVIIGAFQMVLNKVSDVSGLSKLLQGSVLSPEQRFIFDSPLLAALFWQNLLCNRSGQLVWRCEAVRLTGVRVLAKVLACAGH